MIRPNAEAIGRFYANPDQLDSLLSELESRGYFMSNGSTHNTGKTFSRTYVKTVPGLKVIAFSGVMGPAGVYEVEADIRATKIADVEHAQKRLLQMINKHASLEPRHSEQPVTAVGAVA